MPKIPPESQVADDRGGTSLGYWLTIIFIWALFGFWNANQVFIDMQARGMHHSYGRMVLWGIVAAMEWVPLTPLILWMAHRFPLEKPRVWRSVPFHVALFVLLIPSVDALRIVVTKIVRPFDPLPLLGSFSYLMVQGLQGAFAAVLFVYISVTGVGHAIEYRRRAREKEIRAAQLEALLSQAQVLSLKMQLHPHFLFNTLNGIVALVRDNENDSAVQMLLGLSNMLRYALDSSGRQVVPLSDEIEFVKLYLGVEQMRFPDRLQVEMHFEPETLDALVPNLLLQPLVENAIRHGISQSVSAGKVVVRGQSAGGELVLTIEDDGVGLRPDFDEGDADGIGLRNTRSRLAQLYGDAWNLSLDGRAEGGVTVRVSLPFTTVVGEPLLSR